MTQLTDRMQRVMHSIFTARILLNLREAAKRDRSGMVTSNSSSHISRGRNDIALSSAIIGVDTWFRNTQSATQRIGDSELAAV